jgi:hypothetical protein
MNATSYQKGKEGESFRGLSWGARPFGKSYNVYRDKSVLSGEVPEIRDEFLYDSE